MENKNKKKIKIFLLDFNIFNRFFFYYVIFCYLLYNILSYVIFGSQPEIFPQFYYESLLFAKNLLKSDDLSQVFYRNWSTGDNTVLYPLYYFRNLDILHLIVGIIQNIFVKNYNLVFFLIGLFFSILTIKLYFLSFSKHLFKNDIKLQITLTLCLIIILFFGDTGLKFSSKNIFVSSVLFITAYNFYLINKLFVSGDNRNFIVVKLLFCLIFLSLLETNSCLVLSATTAFCFVIFKFYRSRKLNFRDNLINIFLNCLKYGGIFIIPVLLTRLIQITGLYFFSLLDKFIIDIKYTSLLRKNSEININEAIKFYQNHDLVFWGIPSDNTNILNYFIFLISEIGNYIFLISSVLALAGAYLLLNNFKYKIREDKNIIDSSIPYFFGFILSTFLTILATGDGILKVAFSTYAFLNIHLGFLISLIIIPLLLFTKITGNFNKIKLSKPVTKYIKNVMILISITLALIISFQDVNNLGSHGDLKNLESKINNKQSEIQGKYIISNYEPSIASELLKLPVKMSWFLTIEDNLHNSSKLLPIFSPKDKIKGCNYVVFLVNFPPYNNNPRPILLKQYGLSENGFILNENIKIIYQDSKYFVADVNVNSCS